MQLEKMFQLPSSLIKKQVIMFQIQLVQTKIMGFKAIKKEYFQFKVMLKRLFKLQMKNL